MKVTAVSANLQNRINSAEKNQQENIPSFKGVYVKGLKQQDILDLYEDGPGIWRMIKNVTPVLKEKFPMFHTVIQVGRDYFRDIRVSFIRNKSMDQQLKNYIVNKNTSSFQLPRYIIDSFRYGSDDFAGFLDGKNYTPMLRMQYGKLGEANATNRFMQFIRSNNQDSVIRYMYENEGSAIANNI